MRVRLSAVMVLALLGAARAQTFCSYDSAGSTQGQPVQAPDVVMGLNSRILEIGLKHGTTRCPTGSVHMGTTLEACDWSSMPVISMDRAVRGVITRTGRVNVEGIVHITLYCKPVNPIFSNYYTDFGSPPLYAI